MTDPRELAQDFLDMSEDHEIQTLARELLKALDERDRLAEELAACQALVSPTRGHLLEYQRKLLREKGTAEAERDRLREALLEARPYVFNRTQEQDWRGETARDVLGRVNAALEEKKS